MTVDREQGERLREFLRVATGGRHGWVAALARAAHMQRQTLYLWFEGKVDPTLPALEEVARASGTTRSAIVAAIDGEASPPVEERLRELEAVVARLAEERLAGGGTGGSGEPGRRPSRNARGHQ